MDGTHLDLYGWALPLRGANQYINVPVLGRQCLVQTICWPAVITCTAAAKLCSPCRASCAGERLANLYSFCALRHWPSTPHHSCAAGLQQGRLLPRCDSGGSRCYGACLPGDGHHPDNASPQLSAGLSLFTATHLYYCKLAQGSAPKEAGRV